MAPGQMAELTIPEMPGRVFPAKVVRTSGAMSADSRTLLVELEVDNSRGESWPATYCRQHHTPGTAHVQHVDQRIKQARPAMISM